MAVLNLNLNLCIDVTLDDGYTKIKKNVTCDNWYRNQGHQALLAIPNTSLLYLSSSYILYQAETDEYGYFSRIIKI